MALRSNISSIFKAPLLSFLISSALLSVASAAWQPWDQGKPSLAKEEIVTSVPQIVSASSIRFYQIFISPLLRQDKCNFTPSCSNYAMQSIKKYGALKGWVMAFDRLARDNPWVAEGHYKTLGNRFYDPPSDNYCWW